MASTTGGLRLEASRRFTRWLWAGIGALACLGLAVGPARGQAPSAAEGGSQDPHMLMNRALAAYSDGQQESYKASVDLLTRLLEQTPGYAPALLLRALAYGELAVAGDRSAAQQNYRLMAKDMEALWAALGREISEDYAIARLVDGVVLAKVAGFEPQPGEVDRLLARSRAALETYLHPPAGSGLQAPTGLNRVRAEFFLGVIVYRQALQWPAVPEQPQPLKDRARLDEAGQLMGNLENVDQVLAMLPDQPGREIDARIWASYANFYLGLIRTRQANDNYRAGQMPTEVVNTYQEALRYLSAAQELDRDPRTGGSHSALIPRLVGEQTREIQNAVEFLQAAPPRFTEDFRLEWRSGFSYDTNVILLGKDTSTPREIGRKDDVRFATGLYLNYRLDLGKINDELDRWSIGLLGRSSSVWNGDIHTYNEQDYGGSAAVMYEAMRQREDGERHGPLFVGVQYDYDYFLLGNNGFVRMNRVQPRATLYTFNRRLESVLSVRYEDRNYLEELTSNLFDRDGNYFGLGFTQSFKLADATDFYRRHNIQPWGLAHDPTEGSVADTPLDDYQRWLTAYVGAEYGWDSTRGAEFDEKRYLLAAGLDAPLPYGMLFNFGAEWEWQDYQGFRGGSWIDYHRRGRRDLVQRYGIGLQRRFVLVPGQPINRRTINMDRVVMTLRGDIYLTDDDSNVEDRLGQAIFSYDRAVYGLSVAFEFN
ncbi:MAG: hypothetical protein AMXMBFR83_08760 [Phycisphaerae bacterium]